ncbi:MAG: MarR family transcriptional regulator, partial [Rhizobiaceae bacterium]
EHVGGINQDEFKQMNRVLQRLDRFWNDTIAYRM